MTNRDVSAFLPEPYAAALRLAAAGADTASIAIALDVDPAAVPPLLTIAEAKLRELEAESTDDSPPSAAARTPG